MKKVLSALLIAAMAILLVNNSFAKGKKIKYGKVGLADLQMTTYEFDTSAVAVVLYEKGEYDGTNHQFYFHRRLKILKKEGLDFANYEFNTGAKGFIKGITFNLEGGKIIETKLDKHNIYEEKIWDYKFEYNVAMPNVKVGSVLDIEVKYDGFPPVWYFQRSIPVVLSELELGDNQYLTFRKSLGGIIRPQSVGYNHWRAENMPAFISEAYISSDKNYLSRIELDINETHFPGYYALEYTSSWKSVQTILLRINSFGKALEWPNGFLNKYAKEIEEAATTDTEKAKLAVEKIKSLVSWNGVSRFTIAEDNLSEVAKDKEGNSAEINLMLIELLDKLDLDARPMVMSTRANGMLHPTYPSLNKLNYVVAYVNVDGKPLILDATSKDLAWNMLPVRCLNYGGRVLDGHNTQAAIISPKEKFAKRAYYDLTLDENMNLSGKLSYLNKDYAAYSFRNDYKSYLGDQDYVENLANDKDGLSIIDYKIENVKVLEKPVSEKYEIEIEDAVSVIDGQAFINMFLFEQINENPFKLEERKYPVDFAYARAASGVVRIAVPENFTIAELPKPVSISLPEKSAKFTMIYQMNNNVLTLNYKLLINRSVFPENAYLYIKEFYSQVINNQGYPVVFNIN
ncbi:MAG: hypothetical protein GXO88_03030 [Chlorobi bacterium]|nr:hypothetical protein [Chlorobiota bacterium]